MRSFAGAIDRQGPIIDVTLMATTYHVDRLKAANRPIPVPIRARGLIDTGASSSAIDLKAVARLGLIQTGMIEVHTPSGYDQREEYDVSIFFGTQPGAVENFTVGVISSELASQGFDALIGWDILNQCVLWCDGPSMTFRLDY